MINKIDGLQVREPIIEKLHRDNKRIYGITLHEAKWRKLLLRGKYT